MYLNTQTGINFNTVGTYNKILLALIALVYLISPLDLIPDLLLPLVGWIDDAFIVGLIIYYLRFNRLPGFFNQPRGGQDGEQTQESTADRKNQEQPRNRSQGPGTAPPKKPHEILGVAENATRDEIQAAFRAAAKQYHPDRVASLGKEFQELANLKFIEIKDAYTRMMAGKG